MYGLMDQTDNQILKTTLEIGSLMCKPVRKAFTLMEILLAIALIAAMGGFTAMGISMFSESTLKARPIDRLFITTLKLAQSDAILKGKRIVLSYSNTGYFLLKDYQTGEELKRVWLTPELEEDSKKEYDSDKTATPPNVKISFIADIPETVGSENIEFKLEPLKEIHISPDGICTPVTVHFTHENDAPVSLRIDPVSASPKDF